MSTTNVHVSITRSNEWVAARALETGDSVSNTLNVTVPVGQLSPEVRKILLGACRVNGHYPSRFDGCLSDRFEFLETGGYHYTCGSVAIRIDSDVPTPEEVGAAILVADEERQQMKEKAAREQAEKEAAALAKAMEWAALPLLQRASAKGVAYCTDEATGRMATSGTVRHGDATVS